MKITTILGWLIILLIPFTSVYGQSEGDYQTRQSGNWNDSDTWEEFTGGSFQNTANTPDDTDGVITILNTHTVTVTAGVSIDQAIINTGGSIVVNSGIILTVADGSGDDLTIDGTLTNNGTLDIELDPPPPPIGAAQVRVNGTLENSGTINNSGASRLFFESGSTYDHQYTTSEGSIPLANWNATSTCLISGYTSNGNAPSNLNQTFGNFTWNTPSSTAFIDLDGELTTVNGSLNVLATSSNYLYLTQNSALTINVGGDFIVSGNSSVGFTIGATVNINITGNFGYTSSGTLFAAAGGVVNFDVGGDFDITAGTFDFDFGGVTQNYNIGGSVDLTGGTLANSLGGNVNITFDGSGTQNFINTSSRIDIDYSVSTGSTLALTGNNFLPGGGTFNLNTNATLDLGSDDVNGALQTGTSAGNIRVSGARTFDAGSNIVYSGSAAQELGNGFPSDVNLEINNAAGVSLTSSITIESNRTLTFTSGNLAIGDNNTLTINGALSGTASLVGGNLSDLLIGGTGPLGTVSFTGSTELQNFTLNRTSSGSVTLGSTLTIGGTFTQTNGNLDFSGQSLTLSGPYARTSGDFLSNASSTLVVSGTGAISSLSFNGGLALNTLTINRNAATVSTGASLSIVNLNLTDGTFDNSGTITINTGGIVTRTQNSSMTSAPVAQTSYDVIYDAGGAMSTGVELPTSATELNDLTKNGSGTVTLGSNVTVNGVLTLSNGTFDAGSNQVTLDGNFVSNATSTLTNSTFVFATSTILSGSASPSFNNVTVSGVFTPNLNYQINGNLVNNGTLNAGTGSVTFGGTTAITGSATPSFNGVTINAASSLTAPTGTMNVAGSFTNNGTFDGNDGIVDFNGTSSISGNVTFSDITISGTLTAPSGTTFGLEGDFTNNGTFNANNGTVTFSGILAQSIAGTTTTEFYDIQANNAVNVNGNADLRGILTLGENVTFDADGSGSGVLTLLSDAAGDAFIAAIPSNSTVSGDVTYQRFYVASDVWTHFGVPITGVTVADLQDDFPISGSFTGASTGGGISSNPSLYFYDESVGGDVDQGWVNHPTTTNTEAISSTLGYAAWMRSEFTGSGATINVRGPINQGATNLTVTYFDDPGQAADQDGWNLVNNPYPASIDWNTVSGWTRTNINGVAAVWNSSAARYDYTSGVWDGVVASGQAFWVRAEGSPTLSTTEEVKTTADRNPTFFRTKEIQERLAISLTDGTYEDFTFVYIDDASSAEFDSEVDAYKLDNGGIFNISTLTPEGANLAINTTPSQSCSMTLPLNIEDIWPGTFTLSFPEGLNLPNVTSARLIDKLQNTELEIIDGAEMVVSFTDDPATFGADRFEILMFFEQPIPGIVVEAEQELVTGVGFDAYQWFKDGELIEGATSSKYVPVESGLYSVEVTNGQCKVLSESIEFKVDPITSIDDQINKEEVILVYPNPTSNRITVDNFTDALPKNLTVTDLNGRQIISLSQVVPANGQIQLDLRSIDEGIYILNIFDDDNSSQIRIIKR
ncbi:MAG: T9SS type A sorting domain-containing protein [Bacteroidota bacterium]